MLKNLLFMAVPIILSQALNGLSLDRSALNSNLALTLYFNINLFLTPYPSTPAQELVLKIIQYEFIFELLL